MLVLIILSLCLALCQMPLYAWSLWILTAGEGGKALSPFPFSRTNTGYLMKKALPWVFLPFYWALNLKPQVASQGNLVEVKNFHFWIRHTGVWIPALLLTGKVNLASPLTSLSSSLSSVKWRWEYFPHKSVRRIKSKMHAMCLERCLCQIIDVPTMWMASGCDGQV